MGPPLARITAVRFSQDPNSDRSTHGVTPWRWAVESVGRVQTERSGGKCEGLGELDFTARTSVALHARSSGYLDILRADRKLGLPNPTETTWQDTSGKACAMTDTRTSISADVASDDDSPVDGLNLARDSAVSVAESLVERFRTRAAKHDLEASFPHANIEELRAAGWPSLTVPREFGGQGAGLLETIQAHETLARGDGSTSLAIAMHSQTLGTESASRRWPAAMFEDVCRRVVTEGALINSCATEPDLGSPSRGGLPKTTAVPEGSGWRIDGRKTFASLSPVLEWVIIPAALEGEAETIGRFLVPRDAGWNIVENWDPMGMRATGSHDIVLDDVSVPDSALLFRESAAAPDPHRATANAWFTLVVAGVYLGVAAAGQEAAIHFALDRVPTALGRPLSTLEAVQRRLGQAELDLRAARAMLYAVAGEWDERPDTRGDLGSDIVAAKLFVSNSAVAIVEEAMRAVGGSAMRRDLPLERHFRDVRAALYHPPSDDQGLALLGRIALDRFGETRAEPSR